MAIEKLRTTLAAAAIVGLIAPAAGAFAPPAAARSTDDPMLAVPPWLVIGLYEGTIPASAISGLGYGDFDWATMSPGERLRMYDRALREANVDM